MDIRNSLDGLKSLAGVAAPASPATPGRATGTAGASALSNDSATLSRVGSEVSLTATDSDVRMDKVSSIQAALASGSYSVPALAVASKLVDAMMNMKQ